eukprot:561122-Rhodomonas_salina.1
MHARTAARGAHLVDAGRVVVVAGREVGGAVEEGVLGRGEQLVGPRRRIRHLHVQPDRPIPFRVTSRKPLCGHLRDSKRSLQG